MFLRKATNRIAAKAAAVMLSAFTAFSAYSLYPAISPPFAEAASRLPDGIYYIKNVYSSLYLDVYGNNSGDGERINQYTFHGARNQRFRVEYHNSDGGYYTIHTLNDAYNDMVFDLENKDASMRNGTGLQIWANCSSYVAEQRFTIKPATAGPGYEIGTWATSGNTVLEVIGSSRAKNAFIQTWAKSDYRTNDNWYFEEAPFNIAYDTTTTLGAVDSVRVEHIRADFRSLGYSTPYSASSSSPTIASVMKDVKESSVLVLHGHGSPGHMGLPGGGAITSSNASSIFLDSTANHLQLVFYASCKSGADKDDNGKSITSLVDATYRNGKGAKCVIGFRNKVASAEDFLYYMLEYVKANKYATIQNAIKYAQNQFIIKLKPKNGDIRWLPENCPAFPHNLYVVGNTDVILDLRYR